MTRYTFFLAALAALALTGAGCFHVTPRIVTAPSVTSSDQQQVADSNASSTELDTAALAYLKLDAGTANVMRSNQTSVAQEGEAILSGDEVDVTSGTVSLIYPDAGESQLSDNAHVVVLPAGDQSNGSVSEEIQLLAGNIWTRFERELGSSEQFAVASNGVVATVRGTAFGVVNDGTDVDVQVAQNTVWVSSDDASGSPTQSLPVVQGQGLKLNAAIAKSSLADMSARKALRTLTLSEKTKKRFQFGTTPISIQRLRKPVNVFHWNVQPSLPLLFRLRVQILRDRALERLRLIKFGAPTSTPSMQLNTHATLYINGVAQ